MDYSGYLCYNCQGKGHRSSKCPFPPTHRRCPTCGKAGSDFTHRDGCTDSWYNLSQRVPRYVDGTRTILTKEQVENILAEDYTSEKLRHQAQIEATSSRARPNMEIAQLKPSQIENADLDREKNSLKRCAQFPLVYAEAEHRNKHDEHGLDRDPRLLKPLLLRYVFSQRPTVYIDFGDGRDIGMRDTLYQMQNGLDIKYVGGMLEFYGRANESATFILNTVQGALRMKIEGEMVILNGSHIFTGFGLTIRRSTLAMTEPTKYGFTMIGKQEEEIRLRYKSMRYVVKLDGDNIEVNVFEPTQRL